MGKYMWALKQPSKRLVKNDILVSQYYKEEKFRGLSIEII